MATTAFAFASTSAIVANKGIAVATVLKIAAIGQIRPYRPYSTEMSGRAATVSACPGSICPFSRSSSPRR